jgi:hypothetical protein
MISDCQIGFRPNRSTIDKIHTNKYMKNIMNTVYTYVKSS